MLVRELSTSGTQVRRELVILVPGSVYFPSLVFSCCEVHEMVAAAGFLGASLGILDFFSGSKPPQLSIEGLLLTR